MTTKDEALQMALDALDAVEQTNTPYFSMVRTAIEACHEALAQKDEQEPVAWYVPPSSRLMLGEYAKLDAEAEARRCGCTARATPLYTTPPERQPLTDEEIHALSQTMVKGHKSVNWLCRAIEAAHGIGVEHEQR